MTINVSAAKLLKIAEFALLVSIFVLLVWSQPWTSGGVDKDSRKITVSGSAVIEAEPDEFVFYPYFEVTGPDQETRKDEIATKMNTVVEDLKELGVPESGLKLDTSDYDNRYWEEEEEGTATGRLTIKSKDRDLVQKVQDYLLNADAKGQITPYASFSEEKKDELDAEAVEKASNDAKAKAEAQAALFDAKLGKVVTVSQGYESIFDYGFSYRGAELAIAEDSSSSSLPVLPGQNEYTQTVTVVYELK